MLRQALKFPQFSRLFPRLFPLGSRKVTNTGKKELVWPLPYGALQDAFGEEVQLFIHCHLRGYDKDGEGKQLHAEFYDQYGAPLMKNESWLEGYHAIEQRLATHFNICNNDILDFPLVAGMGGATHLYKAIHADEPWNWTGWIPIQRKWLSGKEFFSNRNFLSLRGNEIQNNVWDYDPYREAEDANIEDTEYTPPPEPTDKYRGGYFFYDNPYARYLHIISLKSRIPSEGNNRCTRYNYIVHPLAYLLNQLNDMPDNGVDAMQWSIINIAKEKNFHYHSPWGEKVHGIEIFNDLTLSNSYSPSPLASKIYNGTLTQGTGEKTIHWFNSYPLEYGEFLQDSALARGVYLHTLTANDAFYDRALGGTKNEDAIQTTQGDPKGAALLEKLEKYKNASRVHAKSKSGKSMESRSLGRTDSYSKVQKHLEDLPYGDATVFGYTTLIDTEMKLKKLIFGSDAPSSGLDDAEIVVLDYLRNGSFYSSTGVHDIFDYSSKHQYIPYVIQNQPDRKQMCYDVSDDMSLVFTFEKCKQNQADLIWRYSMMVETESKSLETVHGYFKLNDAKKTVLDLSTSYDKKRVKWLYFNAIKPENPMKRAWFHAIRGPVFGERVDEKALLNLKHKVFSTKSEDGKLVQDTKLQPFPCESGNLDFSFPKFPSQGEDICVYFLQSCPLQQDITILGQTDNSFKTPPPRIQQSVHGYFQMHPEYKTRLTFNLWDKDTVKDSHVYFYEINAKTGKPQNVNPQPHLVNP